MLIRLFRFLLISLTGAAVLAMAAAAFVIWRVGPDLPEIDAIRDIRLQVPLRVYSIDGRLIGEYGDQRRSPVSIDEVPDLLVKAILAAEDDRFYDHPGVDIAGIARAALANLRSGDHGQGASTITMQVARNYFLSSEKTYTRKLQEALLAFRIEQMLSKDDILELYVNKIFLGHRAYGFAAAAQVYYDRPLAELDLSQFAMLAGLPKAPSRTNPLSNPAGALERRNYVLRRMLDLRQIDRGQFEAAIKEPVTAARHVSVVDVEAPYVAEMAREYLVNKYGESAYTAGYKVYTTILAEEQETANRALRQGLRSYDERHGFRGPIGHIDPLPVNDEQSLRERLAEYPSAGDVVAAVVVSAGSEGVEAFAADHGVVRLDLEASPWKRESVASALTAGSVIHIRQADEAWTLSQLPEVSGALVSLDPNDGALLALTGGYDFYLSKFNRATQAKRQPGSNIKPFIYSAALDSGFTAATLVSGAPIVVEDSIEGVWRPENYSGKFFGPTRIREALSKSVNLVSVRLVRAMGTDVVLDHIARFGFDRETLPGGLSLALGTASWTPLEVASAYAVFANGGYRILPYFIARVEDQTGQIIEYSNRMPACTECPPMEALSNPTIDSGPDPRYARRVLSPENAFLSTSLMREVIRSGTGARALELGRNDLAGKTGTTNSFRDAWFSGFNGEVVTTVWVGYDQPRELGRGESGAKAALPIWIDYMRVALDGIPETPLTPPENVVTAYVDADTGEATGSGAPDAIQEYFIMGTEPQVQLSTDTASPGGREPAAEQIKGLF